MKKYLFTIIMLTWAAFVTFGQEDPSKALTKASRALSAYNLDKSGGETKLKEATDMIKIAIESPTTNNSSKTWQTRGEIYIALSDKEITMIALNDSYEIQNPEAPIIAAESFEKALSLAQKKFETKDALKGLAESGTKLTAFGNNQINRNDFNGAYKSLNRVMISNKLLTDNGEAAIIPETGMENHKYVVAYCAQQIGQTAHAKQLFQELIAQKTTEPSVYSNLFYILFKEKDLKAIEVLETGRKAFPENTEILFAEINYYISEQRYDVLEIKLKEAIEREPNNPSVYSALGNVYMNMFTSEFEKDTKSTVAQGYFDKSLEYFNKAVEIDPKQFDAIYSVGSLYFNRAVVLIKMANELGMSAEEQKKYSALEKESSTLLDKSLPYFQRAEALNPNDVNTLIALSEIFARKNDIDKSMEFKGRLEKARSGENNPTSYFKN
jgi:tetratricopeptide (TPR) repeat protein